MKRDAFQAIADPTRRAILLLLATQGMTPNTLAERFDMSRQAVSKHIRVLKESEVVEQRKAGREIYYHIKPEKMKEIDQWLEQFRQRWEERFLQLDQVLTNLRQRKMKTNLLMDFSVDKEKKTISVKREFAAALSLVWDAYTKSEILDQWWAPKPWRARTKAMDFREGGHWLYAMVGPEGEEHWARADYLKIDRHKSFRAKDGFADGEGNINRQMPQSYWEVTFSGTEDGTLVTNQITFDDLQHLEQTLEMGFKEGYVMALENLDEWLRQR